MTKTFEMEGGTTVTQGVTVAALKDLMQRQVLAPTHNGRKHFAASRPGQDLQVDLIDFSRNTSQKNENRCLVLGADVCFHKVENMDSEYV